MKRLLALFFALAGVIYSSSTLAAVCFLADTECQEGKFAVDKTTPCRDQNSSWYHESQLCKGLVYGNVVCNDATGNYYEEGTCPSGYTDFRTVDTTKYKCADNPNGSLLCDRCCKNVVCLDKYHECKSNSVPKYPSDVCVEPADGTKKYTECECHDPYKETCTGTGITNGTGGYCVDDEGKRFYKDCQCSSGYTEVSLSDIKCPSRCEYDCLNLGTKVQLPGSNSKYCWTGAECKPKPEPQCTISYQSDFDNFWQGYDAATDCTNLTVDCNTLGYDTGSAETGVKCKDGSEPYRCPFDHAMVYCESGIEDTGDTCTYTTASECETYYFGSLCRADGNGCYNPYACATGYGKTIKECSGGKAGNWSLGGYDAFGCSECKCTRVCDNEYTGSLPDNAEWVSGSCDSCGITTTVHIGWKCKTGYQKNAAGTGCILSTCPTGYAKTADDCYNKGSAGWSLDLTDKYDSTDCYKCTAKSCEVGYSTDVTTCEAGYEIVTNGYSGEQECKKCDKSPCSAGYSDTITSETDCSAGYSFKQDPDNPLCGMCVEKSCPDGSSKDIKSVADCGNGSVGAAGWIFSSSNGCGKCTERPCSGNVHHTSIDKCGIGGAEGWNFSACYYGDHILGTCTAKTCKDHHMQDVRTDIGLLCKAKQVYLGNTKTDCYDCVACEDAGLSGAIFTRINDCSAICPLTGYSSTTMIYNSARTAILHDAEGRYGVCYAWNAVSCSSSSHFGDCYCKYGTSVSSCN